ncbi:uncharacterized protein LOC130713859 isoform X2 [Lotus japonicus]|uniref:uncharacterized protein LOC130713859 isoform X2 n=1 Tax=Lotus japonicus TaxID=34305 RepID=UPI00258D0199|nr:uncharacterized protein LOC130713859 isoform X2 [Lotus japonicus]
MGANLCTLCHIIPCQKSKSSRTRKGSPSKEEGIQDNCGEIENTRRLSKILKRKIDMETPEKTILMPRNLTLHDWIVASPSLKPEYLMRGELCGNSMKKVHPCSGQFLGSLLSETKDSLCLDRPINHDEESEDMSNCSLICKSLSGKSQKSEQKKPYKGESESEGSFFSPMGPNCRENSFESSAEEPAFRLAVHILPHVFVSSKV